jgi:hypothetical protein
MEDSLTYVLHISPVISATSFRTLGEGSSPGLVVEGSVFAKEEPLAFCTIARSAVGSEVMPDGPTILAAVDGCAVGEDRAADPGVPPWRVGRTAVVRKRSA